MYYNIHMEKQQLIDNLNTIRSEIPQKIEIVAASKTRDIDTIRFAQSLGITVFGENKVQEWQDKYAEDVTWDFIGRLQTNKVKYLVGKVRYIQSVDREELAEVISKEAIKKGITQEVLVEVNMGKEAEKGGVYPESAISLAERIAFLKNVKVRGIMVVMPNTKDESILRPLYQDAKELFLAMQSVLPDIDVFSGGMSGDYKIAAEYGVTSVRLGRVLFGERVY